jgi:DNA-binding transcriptional LysR family regulator
MATKPPILAVRSRNWLDFPSNWLDDDPMMNWNDAFLFVQVIEQGGFSAAARVLQLPKSSIAHRIAMLEGELGARLIQRTSRRFAPTEAGQAFLKHAAAMLAEATAAEDAVHARAAEPVGAVRITTSPGIAQAGLAEVLAGFLAAFPKVRLTQHVANRNVDLLDERFDLAIRAHQVALPDSGLIQRTLGFSPRWLVASPGYILRFNEPACPEDLADHLGLSMSAMEGAAWSLQHRGGDVAKARPTPRLSTEDPFSLKVTCLQGLGIAVLPAGLCRAEIAAKALVRVLPDWIAGGAHISLLTPHRRGQLPSVRALVEALVRGLPGAMRLE